MRTKIWSICALIFCILLVSCGKKEDAEETDEYATATLFCDVSWWKPPLWKEEEGTITGDISRKTGLKLDIMQPTQRADTQLKIMLLNDELPDIISVTDATTISQLVDSGKVWRIDEFLEAYMPDSHILQFFPEDIKNELIKRDNGWYAFPSHINSADARAHWKSVPYMEEIVKYGDNNAVIWNKDLLAQAGLEEKDLQTEGQVLSAFEKVKNMGLTVDGQKVIVLLVDGKDYTDPTLKYLEGSFGAEWVDDAGNYRDILLQPQTKNALRFLNTAMRNAYAYPGQLTMETEQVGELMQSGRVLCFIGNIANLGIDTEEWVSAGVILPADGSLPVLGKNLRASTGWISTFISKTCENPDKIARFLDYMTSDEGLALWEYGYEGIDYTVGEDGCFYRTDPDAGANYTESGIDVWWMFSNTAWERSVIVEPESGSGVQRELSIAYGSHEKTVIYDSSLLIMPRGLIPKESMEGKIETEIETWKDKHIIQIVLAENETAFEREYQIFIQGLYDLGIEQLDARRNEGYRQNCLEYGNHIEKINKTLPDTE